MIGSIGDVSAAGATGASSTNRTQLGKEDFLQLLVTQLRNQDPLSPLQPHEFAAQLAEFGNVEQLINLNASIAQQTATAQLEALVAQTSLSASLIGRRILAEGNQVVVPEAGTAQVQVEIAEGGGNAVLEIFDTAGQLVRSVEIGAVEGGRRDLALPEDLPPGTYEFAVRVTTEDGDEVPVITYTSGVVDGVHFRNGQIVLRMGSVEVLLDALVEITPGETTGAA